jgi:hypothetical protein
MAAATRSADFKARTSSQPASASPSLRKLMLQANRYSGSTEVSPSALVGGREARL